MTGAGVVGLSCAHHFFVAVGVAELQAALEEVSPVLALAGVVGQPLEKLRVVEARRYRLEADVVVPELGHSPLVVATFSGGSWSLDACISAIATPPRPVGQRGQRSSA